MPNSENGSRSEETYFNFAKCSPPAPPLICSFNGINALCDSLSNEIDKGEIVEEISINSIDDLLKIEKNL